jgi:hypothetical protein
MESVLKAAQVPEEIMKLLRETVDTCRICRLWQRPGNRQMASVRLSMNFNEVVQVDLLFVGDWIILHMIDEAIRWSMACSLIGREAQEVCEKITVWWLRIFGPMMVLVTDHEGALDSEYASHWSERWGIHLKKKARYQHAHLVERHHEILRSTLKKIKAQLDEEGLLIGKECIIAEAVFAKNAMIRVFGSTPYTALLGRNPVMLRDFEGAAMGALTDEGPQGSSGILKNVNRVREIACQKMLEGTANDRMTRADKTKTRRSGELLDLQIGDEVDLYRSPPNKDLTGWRGPARVTDIGKMHEGVITVDWNSRKMDVAIPDCRRHLILLCMLALGHPTLNALKRAVMELVDSSIIVSWVFGAKGWELSKEARLRPTLFGHILRAAQNDFQVIGCVGARLGRGVESVSGLYNVDGSTLWCWPEDEPDRYKLVELPGTQRMRILHLIGKEWRTWCWVQFFQVGIETIEEIYQRDPSASHQVGGSIQRPTHLGPSQQPWSSADENDRLETIPEGPSDTEDETSEDWQSAHSETFTAMLEEVKTYKPEEHEVPLTEDEIAWHHITSAQTSAPQQLTDSDIHSQREPQLDTAQILRYLTDTQDVSQSLRPPDFVGYDKSHEEIYSKNGDCVELQISYEDYKFFTGLTVTPKEDECIVLKVHLGVKPEIQQVIEKAFDTLDANEVRKNYELVREGMVKEIRSWTALDTVKPVFRHQATNIVDGKWVHKWKLVDGKRIIKSRLTLRGFKDLQGNHIETFAGTASRWGQRLICSVAAMNNWPMFSSDVGAAFLKGVTFEDLAKVSGTPLR